MHAAYERRVQNMQVHNRSCVKAARISKRAMHAGKQRKVHPCERSACNMPRRDARKRPASCSDPAHIRAREACSAQRPWRMMQNTSRCRRVIGRRNLLLDARPVSCSDRAHIRAREACSAQRPWRMMQNTSRCRRVIGRRHHLRSTPAPLRPLAAAPPCPKSPRAREVCGGSKLEAALKLLNGKSSGPRPQFVPVPFGLNLPLDFVP